MFSSSVPSARSTTCDSLHRGPATPPSFHVLPASSLRITWDCRAWLPLTQLSHGTTSRPPRAWMPTPGPVAYHVQSALLTSRVISTGRPHVRPSSSLFVTQTVRVPLAVPSRIFASVSPPRLCVMSSQTVPVLRSRTAQGLPQVLSPSSQTTWALPQVLPPSVL